MVQSVRETTKDRVTVCAYIDVGDAINYASIIEKNRPKCLQFYLGKRVGPTASLNRLARMFEPSIMGIITDDARLLTPDWDLWLEDAVQGFPGRLGVVSAFHHGGPYCNFPFISHEMLDLIGWYAYPGTYHFAYDGVLELLGAATAIRYATSDEMLVHHLALGCLNADKYRPDAERFIEWCVKERRPLVRTIRNAQDAAAASPPSRSPIRSTG